MKFEDVEIKKVFKDEAKDDAKNDGIKRFPVRMKRGYFPVDPTWEKNPATGEPMKILAGQLVELPIDEARKIIKAGIAERADEITI